MLVLRLGQVERELVVDRQVVETTFSDGVAEIVVLSITFLAMVTSYAFFGAVTDACLVVAQNPMAVTLTLLAVASIRWVAKVTIHTPGKVAVAVACTGRTPGVII